MYPGLLKPVLGFLTKQTFAFLPCTTGDGQLVTARQEKMKAKHKHTNIIARDWQALAQFHQDAFGCLAVSPKRELSGDWLDK